MSTSEHPETPPLTRRQLREMRNTGATPIIAPGIDTGETDAAAPVPGDAAAANDAASSDETPAVDETSKSDETSAVAEAAESVGEPEAAASEDSPAERPAAAPSFVPPFADPGADHAVSGLTRRQARAQEKIRTASIPVVTHDLEPSGTPVGANDESPSIFKPAPEPAEAEQEGDAVEPDSEIAAPTAVVNPDLGSELLQGATPEVTLPPSFDQLIARSASATGSISTPNALILSQTPSGAPLVAPINSTGEVLITGTFDLPHGLGSIGHAPGTTDGRDADAVLIDGELPPASSPTPIAASAAISTVKQPGEIIRPPAPEKGSRLMLTLAITAGALALALVGVLVVAFTTGVF